MREREREKGYLFQRLKAKSIGVVNGTEIVANKPRDLEPDGKNGATMTGSQPVLDESHHAEAGKLCDKDFLSHHPELPVSLQCFYRVK